MSHKLEGKGDVWGAGESQTQVQRIGFMLTHKADQLGPPLGYANGIPGDKYDRPNHEE